MWISKKKLEELIWIENDKVRKLYNTSMIEDQKFRDQIDLSSRIEKLEKQVKKLKKATKKGW
jgi:hypothetical protein